MAINLSKGQSISLEKKGGGTLTKVRMGLGWDPLKKSGFFGKLMGGDDSIDLDASCILFDANKNALDTVWFRQLKSRDGAIRHSGDNLTGEGDGDDEVIFVDLQALPAGVQSLVFTVNSFRGQTFNEVGNAFCRLVDDTNNTELAKFNLSEKGSHTGVVMATVSREGAGWAMKAVGNATAGRTAQDIAPAAAAVI